MTRIFLYTVALLMLQVAIAAADTHVAGTITELTTTVTALAPGDTLLLRDATYTIPSYAVTIRADRVVSRSLSGDRERVVVTGAESRDLAGRRAGYTGSVWGVYFARGK